MSLVRRLKKLGEHVCPEGSKITGRTIKGVIRSIYENFDRKEEEVITNLTGTTWKFNDIITPYPETINLNFRTNYKEREYIGIAKDSEWGNMRYGMASGEGEDVYYDLDSKWKGDDLYGQRKTIEILGGEDVTNVEVISWFTEHATRVDKLEELPELPVEDLTGTTWRFNDVPETGHYYPDKSCFYNQELDFTSNSKTFEEISQNSDGIISYSIYNSEFEDYENTNAYSPESGWLDENYKTISISGGNNVKDRNLIYCFTKIATLVE